jgi:hypothetical protein
VAASGSLGSAVIAAPNGYAVSTSSDVKNGPISPSDFDKLAGKSGAATLFGFTNGYEETYDNSSSADSIDISLATFASASEAASFVSTAVQAELDSASDEAPTQQAYPSIPGAVEVDGTKLTADGSVDHEVTLTKGTTFMVFDYSTDHVGTVPDVFHSWVASQYARL